MVYIGPYAGVNYNLTLCPLQSRLKLKHNYYGQLCQSRLYRPVRDFGFGLGLFLVGAALTDVSLA